MVRENALPDWVGDALTDGAAASGAGEAAAAVAPAAADDGEVVTSRETPLCGARESAVMASSQPRSVAQVCCEFCARLQSATSLAYTSP